MNRPTEMPELADRVDDGAPPATRAEQADLADKYDRMLRLADLFDAAGQQVRDRSLLGDRVLHDPDVACTTGTESSMASWAASAPSIREKGVRRPDAMKVSCMAAFITAASQS